MARNTGGWQEILADSEKYWRWQEILADSREIQTYKHKIAADRIGSLI